MQIITIEEPEKFQPFTLQIRVENKMEAAQLYNIFNNSTIEAGSQYIDFDLFRRVLSTYYIEHMSENFNRMLMTEASS